MSSSLQSVCRAALRRALTPQQLHLSAHSRSISTLSSSISSSAQPLCMSPTLTVQLRYIDPSASPARIPPSAFILSPLPALRYSRLQQPLLPSLSSPPVFTTTASLPPLPADAEDSAPLPFPSLPSVDCPPADGGVSPLSCHLTYNPNVLKRKRTHGFLARKNKKTGRRILMRRLGKGRKRMAA